MEAGIGQGSRQLLSEILSTGKSISPQEALRLLFHLVRRVVELHANGRLHLEITPDTILIGPEGVELNPWLETISTANLKELLNWTPEESHRLPRSLPTELLSARVTLVAAGITVDPRSFDLLQIGDVFCQMLTTQKATAYRRSVRVKSLVPVECRPLVERLLEADGRSQFESAQALLASLSGMLEGNFEQPEPCEAGKANPVTPLTSKGDTTQSGSLREGQSGALREGTGETSSGQSSRPGPEVHVDELPFQRLGHFEIHARIGRGGMGDVYQGYERSLDRTVAIKVLPRELARQQEFVRRFRAEATAAARLVHPNIVQIYFIGEDLGFYYFAMQYVDGMSLSALLDEKKKLYVNTSTSLVEQVLLALEQAHSLGFVHRDIKPSNILIDRNRQRALLADFGLVKLTDGSNTDVTATGIILGTVDYISPEAGRGHQVDNRSDLYSLGVLMYRLLSGELPFQASSATALIFKHVYEQPRALTKIAPHVPEELAAIVHKLMQKDPGQRYQAARDVLTDLHAFREQQPLRFASTTATSQGQAVDDDDLFRTDARLTAEIENLLLPVTPEGIPDSAADKTGWQRWLRRLWVRFQEHSPQALLDLQSTQQQLQGALDVYDLRRSDLEKLVSEAVAVRDELAEVAIHSRGQLDELTIRRQLAEQEGLVESLQLETAKLRARYQQLVSQRDLLNARLKAAQARYKVDGAFDRLPIDRRKTFLIASILVGLVSVVFLATFPSWVSVGHRRNFSSTSMETTDLLHEGSSLKPEAPLPAPPAPDTPESDVAPVLVDQDDWAEQQGMSVDYVNSIGMKLRLIPPGEFLMGSTNSDYYRQPDELPSHRVRITKSFWMGALEVTKQQFNSIMGENPAAASQGELAADNIAWFDANNFCEALSARPQEVAAGMIYRLPTEAEWEYACRAGSNSIVFWDGDLPEIGKYVWNGHMTIGGKMLPNRWGLFDMQGNVTEWCSDWYSVDTYGASKSLNPIGPLLGTSKVHRGSTWDSPPRNSRSATRGKYSPSERYPTFGFRVVGVKAETTN